MIININYKFHNIFKNFNWFYYWYFGSKPKYQYGPWFIYILTKNWTKLVQNRTELIIQFWFDFQNWISSKPCWFDYSVLIRIDFHFSPSYPPPYSWLNLRGYNLSTLDFFLIFFFSWEMVLLSWSQGLLLTNAISYISTPTAWYSLEERENMIIFC